MLKGSCLKGNHLKTGRYYPNLNSFFKNSYMTGFKKGYKSNLSSEILNSNF